MITIRSKQSGFTLLEMLLVIGVMSVILVMIGNYTTQKAGQLRRDVTVVQMQQILNAGLAYYINSGAWPTTSTTPVALNTSPLVTSGYLPTLNSPYSGAIYSIYTSPTTGATSANNMNFTVALTVNGARATSDATIIAGMLPLSSLSGTTVTATVNIPGQNLNNARSYNFGALYHNEACVPAPTCPGNMVPDILVIPVSVSGVNDANTSPTTTYPITSFTGYAYGAYNGGGSSPSPTPVQASAGNPSDCLNTTSSDTCQGGQNGGTIVPQTYYWRVCLRVVTDKGLVAAAGWGQYATVAAFTRCIPPLEPSGSDFSVFAP